MTHEGDWVFLKTALSDLRDYILSAEIYWTLRPPARSPGGFQLSQLTIGNLLLSQARLRANDLPPQRAQELAELSTQIAAVRSDWRANWGRKADEEFRSRLNLWQQYLRELRAEPRHSAAIYAREVRQRAILYLLSTELSREVPANEAEQIAMLDNILRGISQPGPFVWEAELADGFPPAEYWFLYRSVTGTKAQGE
jgi:hypothetical protein